MTHVSGAQHVDAEVDQGVLNEYARDYSLSSTGLQTMAWWRGAVRRSA